MAQTLLLTPDHEGARRRSQRLRLLGRRPSFTRDVLVASDLVAAAGTLALARAGVLSVVALGVVLLALSTPGARDFRLHVGPPHQTPSVRGRVGPPLLVLGAIGLGLGRARDVLVVGLLAITLVVTVRSLAGAWLVRLRSRGLALERGLVVGGGHRSSELAAVLHDHPELGVAPVGLVGETGEDVELVVPHLGPVSRLGRVVRELDARHLFVVARDVDEAAVDDVLAVARRARLSVRVVPAVTARGVGTWTPGDEDAWGIPLRRVRATPYRAAGARVAKRALDIALVAPILLLATPLLLACTIAVRTSSPGPILFRQRRVGQHGREFDLLKFRSMAVNDDSDTTWNVGTDDRVTRAGRILRATSLDELPQLWNVVRGDMSLVGPRPERRHFVDQFVDEVPGYRERHRMPVGLTGWAQVNGLRGDTSIAERARFDNEYIERWSPWRDLVILARTIGVVVRREAQ